MKTKYIGTGDSQSIPHGEKGRQPVSFFKQVEELKPYRMEPKNIPIPKTMILDSSKVMVKDRTTGDWITIKRGE